MMTLPHAGAQALSFAAFAMPASAATATAMATAMAIAIAIGTPCVCVRAADGGCVFTASDAPPSADAVIKPVSNASGKAESPISFNRLLKFALEDGETVLSNLPGFGSLAIAADGKSGT